MEPFNVVFFFFLHFKTSQLLRGNAVTLFCCEAPEMFCWIWNLTWFPTAWRWADHDWILPFRWTNPLMTHSTVYTLFYFKWTFPSSVHSVEVLPCTAALCSLHWDVNKPVTLVCNLDPFSSTCSAAEEFSASCKMFPLHRERYKDMSSLCCGSAWQGWVRSLDLISFHQ